MKNWKKRLAAILLAALFVLSCAATGMATSLPEGSIHTQHTKGELIRVEWSGETNCYPWGYAQHERRGEATLIYACGGTINGEPCTGLYEEYWHMYSTLEDHSWDDGVCTECGDVCEHSNAIEENEPTGAFKYEQCTEADHLAYPIVNIFKNCGYCGEKVLVEENAVDPVGSSVPHDWEDGICISCGEVCEHVSGNFVSSFWGYEYDEYDDYFHYKYDADEVIKICYFCGEEIGRYTQRNYDTEVVEEHSFKDGACEICEYECPHYGTDVSEVRNTGRYQVTDIDATEHYQVEDVEIDYSCNACGEFLYTEVSGGDGAWEEHSFEDGQCTVCGAKNSAVCTHEHRTKEYEDYYFTGQCTLNTNYGHIAVYELVETYRCTECHEYFNEETGKTTERSEPHDLSEGVCMYCGWKNQCAHENVYYEYGVIESDTVSFGNITGTTHDATGDFTRFTVCRDCGETLEYDYFTGTITQPHEWDYVSCMQCGYTTDCEHPNMTAVEEANPYGGVWYDQVKKDTHVRHWESGTRYACPDCGMDYWEYEESAEKQEKHTMQDGVCTGCSYVEGSCPHENARSVGDLWIQVDEEYTYVNELNHANNWFHRTRYWCDDCGVGFNVDAPVQEVLTRHSWENGQCSQCGAESKCTHPENQRMPFVHVEYIDDVIAQTETTHTLSGRFAQGIECTVCSAVIGEVEYLNEYTEEHGYDGEDVCGYCGHVNTCDHRDKGIDTMCTEFVVAVYSVTKDEHVARFARYDQDFCAACGQVVEIRAQGAIRDAEEAHKFVDGFCTVCGYEQDQVWTEMNVPGEIAGDYVNVRRQPTTAGKKVGSVSAGTQVKVLYEVKAADEIWYYVELPDGSTGYIFGELITLGAPEAEPAYVEAEATAYGIAVTEDADIVKTVRMIAEAVAQKSETAEVTVCNIELLLTEEELAQLKELDLNEQLIVSLCAIGFEKQVDKAMAAEEEPLTLSDAAIALKTAVSERIAAMTEEEKAAFDALIAEHFPKNELISYDDRTFESFRLEVEITDGEEIVREAYEFRLEKTRWLLTKVLVKAE